MGDTFYIIAERCIKIQSFCKFIAHRQEPCVVCLTMIDLARNDEKPGIEQMPGFSLCIILVGELRGRCPVRRLEQHPLTKAWI